VRTDEDREAEKSANRALMTAMREIEKRENRVLMKAMRRVVGGTSTAMPILLQAMPSVRRTSLPGPETR
jgi:hypothetical protein